MLPATAVGLYGLGEMNEAGEQLEDFCLEYEMALANTMFKQHPRRLYTWTSQEAANAKGIPERFSDSPINDSKVTAAPVTYPTQLNKPPRKMAHRRKEAQKA